MLAYVEWSVLGIGLKIKHKINLRFHTYLAHIQIQTFCLCFDLTTWSGRNVHISVSQDFGSDGLSRGHGYVHQPPSHYLSLDRTKTSKEMREVSPLYTPTEQGSKHRQTGPLESANFSFWTKEPKQKLRWLWLLIFLIPRKALNKRDSYLKFFQFSSKVIKVLPSNFLN